jgi:hypothetical protein
MTIRPYRFTGTMAGGSGTEIVIYFINRTFQGDSTNKLSRKYSRRYSGYHL